MPYLSSNYGTGKLNMIYISGSGSEITSSPLLLESQPFYPFWLLPLLSLKIHQEILHTFKIWNLELHIIAFLAGRDHYHDITWKWLVKRNAVTVIWIPHGLWQEVVRYLCFLKRGHAAAQHSTAVPADLQEDLFVVSCTAVLCRFQHCRQSGPVDDQPVVLEFIRQAAETHAYTRSDSQSAC